MDATTIPTNPGWRVQLAVHRAVRRDAGRLAAALAEGQKTDPAAIRAYWSVTVEQLHHHHVFEDSVIWPLMRERLGDSVSSLLDRNAQEHVTMAEAMDEFRAAVASIETDTTAARAALARMQEAIEVHLAHEEADVLPLIPDAFTPEDLAFFMAESGKTNPPDAFLPWVLESAPDEDVTFFTGSMPEPVRSELVSNWLPRWHTTVDTLQHGRTEAAIG
jgi:hypothetical protein